MRRRRFLRIGCASFAVAGAGCLGEGLRGSAGIDESVVEDRPDAVYVPTHTDGMEMVGMGQAGDYAVGLMYSRPHQFWTVTGEERERVGIQDDEDLHLMATVWDPDTETVLPVGAGLSMTVEQDGDLVTERSPWPMISQSMGFHYGDNFALDGAGEYTVEVAISGTTVRRFGDFEGQFEESASVGVDLEYDPEAVADLSVMQFDERQGEEGATDLMEMGMMPTSTVPEPDDLPGRALGEGESDDAAFVARAVESSPFVDGDGTYLLVSPRTPYNRVPLPVMTLSATVERDGETVFEGDLREAIEPSAGHHYGAVVDGLEAGDDLTVEVGAPPQVSRHQGYEMAFLEMQDVELTLE